MNAPVYLRRPPDWEEHEKPALPGSPAMPWHAPWERVCYALVAILVGLTGGLGNALFMANMPTIQGQLGLAPSEALWLQGAYVTFNATANLLVYKFRQQYGMRLFTEIGLGVYALLSLLHLVWGSPHSLLWLRAASGMVAATCTTLALLYMLQALPRKHVARMVIVGVGISQLATPLAWVLSPSLLAHGNWQNLYLFEAGLALMAFAAVVVLKLPTGLYIQSFEPLDFLTMALLIPGVGLLVAVLVQGTTRWWLNDPMLGWMLAAAIGLLVAGFCLEHHRRNPLLQTRWFLQAGTVQFIIGALILRFLTSEQNYGVVGMMRMLGMSVEQMQPLFLVILSGMVLGIAVSALTFRLDYMRLQLVAAAALLGSAAFLDAGRSSLDRPADLFLSQFLAALGAGVFMGPMLLQGVLMALRHGPNHMVTVVVTISLTQSLGGLAGAAALGTYQAHREQVYSSLITAHMVPTDPQVAARLQLQQQALRSHLTDPVLRAAQARAQLAQVARREANVRAYADVFRALAIVAVAYLIWSLLMVPSLGRLAARLQAGSEAPGPSARASAPSA